MTLRGDFDALIQRYRELNPRKELKAQPSSAATPATVDTERLERLGIPRLFWSAEVGDFGDSQVDRHEDFMELFNGQPCDILIHGKNGRGKSRLAAAMANRWGAKWCSVPRFLVSIRSVFGRAGGESEVEVLERYSLPRVVVLDDLTACAATDFARATLLALLDERLGAMRPTIVTSYHGRDAVKEFDPSVASRISGFKRVFLVGDDRRAMV